MGRSETLKQPTNFKELEISWKAVKGGALKRLPNELYFKPDLDVYRQTVKIGRPPKETANFPGKTNS